MTPGDRAHVARALASFDSGSLPAGDLEAWADAVEGRDDIGRTSEQERLLNDLLMSMSTPELFGGLDAAVATVRARLTAAR